jgi:hypothetical protein
MKKPLNRSYDTDSDTLKFSEVKPSRDILRKRKAEQEAAEELSHD